MKLKGTVRNVADFGAFVDIGVHQDGLVHISQLCNRYVKHPSEVVTVGDIVDVACLLYTSHTVNISAPQRALYQKIVIYRNFHKKSGACITIFIPERTKSFALRNFLSAGLCPVLPDRHSPNSPKSVLLSEFSFRTA